MTGTVAGRPPGRLSRSEQPTSSVLRMLAVDARPHGDSPETPLPKVNAMPALMIVLAIVVVLVFLSLRVVKEYDRGVIFFLGKYTGVRGPGSIILIPVFEQMTRVTLCTITMNIPAQKIITKDNVSIDIAAVAYYHVVDPVKATISIENVQSAVNQISQTTVRNVVGQFQLDQLLSQTGDINMQIKDVIDGHTEPWGVQVTA